MKRAFLFVVSLFIALPAFATVFGTVRGIVHDPQHRPVQDVTVTLKAKTSSYVQTAQTDPNGEFHFDLQKSLAAVGKELLGQGRRRQCAKQSIT